MNDIHPVTKIAKCLGVQPARLEFNAEKVMTLRNNKKQSVTGYASILNSLAKESKSEISRNSLATREVEAQVYQWIEYAVLYVSPGLKDKHLSQQLFRDLNKLFSKKSYLVDHFITLADLAVFYAIFDLVKSFSPIEKENYLNLSRWFDHLQQQPEVRNSSGELLNFATIYLHGWATGTHV